MPDQETAVARALVLPVLGLLVLVVAAVAGLAAGPLDYRLGGFAALLVASVFAIASASWLRGRRRTPLAVALTMAAVLAVTGLQAARRGVVWPWTPRAVAFPTDVCAALAGTGIDQIWPPQQRHLYSSGTEDTSSSTFSFCRFTFADGRYSDSRFVSLSVSVDRRRSSLVISPVAAAARTYRSDLAGTRGPRTLAGLGDEAFAGHWSDRTRVEGRRADVVVQVQLRADPGAADEEAEVAAGRRILTELLAQVRVG